MVVCNKNIPQDMRPMTQSDYTVKITEGFANEWLQENNYAAGQSGTRGISDTGDNCKYLLKSCYFY
jgi:hypothetical protein